MKKTSLAVAALLTTLSSVSIVPVAFADATTDAATTMCQGCSGCKACAGCKGCAGATTCSGCKGAPACSGCAGAPTSGCTGS